MLQTKNNHSSKPVVGKKLYYTISEVCQMTNLEPHALRGWEKDFTQLRPKKNRSGNRAYKDRDIELILRIKHLLQEEKYTVSGAQKKITEERREERLGTKRHNEKKSCEKVDLFDTPSAPFLQPPENFISEIRNELVGILTALEK
ncbi:MAG: MerR family transcriptional regulator [Chitinispirillales bacterium]|jgi:DNA-binding transcriptional MerR regulator|nr:MerR family transcriptional regulator [Chitinispirillales bacterium]